MAAWADSLQCTPILFGARPDGNILDCNGLYVDSVSFCLNFSDDGLEEIR